MKADELLAGVAERSLDHERRALAAVKGLTDAQFNLPVDGEWSVAKVFRHLIMADGPYLDAAADSLQAAGADTGREVKHSIVGKLLIRGSAKNANTPAPKFLIPEDVDYSKDIVGEWKALKERLREVAERAKGSDLSFGVRNPFIKFFPMNVGDLIAVIDVHTERHVSQIEERAQIARSK